MGVYKYDSVILDSREKDEHRKRDRWANVISALYYKIQKGCRVVNVLVCF